MQRQVQLFILHTSL